MIVNPDEFQAIVVDKIVEWKIPMPLISTFVKMLGIEMDNTLSFNVSILYKKRVFLFFANKGAIN